MNKDAASILCEIRMGSCNHQTDQHYIRHPFRKPGEENCKKSNRGTTVVDVLVASGFFIAKRTFLLRSYKKVIVVSPTVDLLGGMVSGFHLNMIFSSQLNLIAFHIRKENLTHDSRFYS